MNKENIDELKKYVDFDILQDIENIAGVLESDLFQEHYDEFMRIVPILTKNGKGHLITTISYLSTNHLCMSYYYLYQHNDNFSHDNSIHLPPLHSY